MKDQVDELNRRGIHAAAVHAQTSGADRRWTWRAARNGELRLLHVAPERFRSASFMALLREVPVSRFVVDEAHCVSQW